MLALRPMSDAGFAAFRESVELPRQEPVGELWLDIGSGKRPGVAYVYMVMRKPL